MGEHTLAAPFWRDAVERVLWTAAEAGLATAITIAAELDVAWAPILTVVLTVAKTQVAKFLGERTAAIGA